ncbi:MAG TPA: sigma factor [Nonomuraea sp.]|nr:sigma factor [Nonomuraea sp.]
MPGWPTVDRADEQELVAALLRADADAPARLFDSYADRLHDYAFSLSGERDLATDAVHDALVTAYGCVARLKEPARLRAWLYALTRFQARARLAHRNAPAQQMPDLEEPADPELAGLVRETLGELGEAGREVLELSLRHGLTPSEAGAVLALTSRQAAGRLARARDQLEIAAAAVVLARTGRAHCPDLSAMVDSWEGPLTPLLRRRLSGHIGGCDVCTEGRHRQVSAGRLLDMVPVAYPPISLRRRVIDTCLDPERGHTRTLIMDRGDSFDRVGFPVPAGRRPRRRRPRGLAPVVLAGACVLAATGAMAVIGGGEAGNDPAPRVVPAEAGTASAGVPEGLVEEGEPATPDPDATASSRRPEPSGRPTATRPDARPAVAPTTRPRRTPAPATPRRRPAPGARLAAACPDGIDGIEGTATIGLRARDAAVAWVATASEGLDVHPASGSIRTGGSVRIRVTVVDPDTGGTGRVAFTSNGGTATCSLSWTGQEPQASGPPDDEPTASPDPTGSPTAQQTSSAESTGGGAGDLSGE